MTLILFIIGVLMVYMLVHLGVMYIHAKYKIFEDETTVGALHFMFLIIGSLSIFVFILFLSSL